jgi:spoIIIJ-associated protein
MVENEAATVEEVVEVAEETVPAGQTAERPAEAADVDAAAEADAEIEGAEEGAVAEDEPDGEDEDEGEPGKDRQASLENEGELAADYLEELLDIADLDGDIDTYVDGGRAHVSILTDSDTLVGQDGEVLEALQELCRLAVMTETGHRSRLMLDVGGYREKRRKELRALAAEAIAEAKETGEAIPLPTMNPFERKIVHDEVAAAGLYSESEGEEPQRRVVVHPVAPEVPAGQEEGEEPSEADVPDGDAEAAPAPEVSEAGEGEPADASGEEFSEPEES